MASYYGDMQEREIISKVAEDWFPHFDAVEAVGSIDFALAVPHDASGQMALWAEERKEEKEEDKEQKEYLLWAVAKQGAQRDICEWLVQLILTIGREKTYDKFLPPLFLGAFDAEKIAFIAYAEVADIFYQDNFNWNVTPSNRATKEFVQLHVLVEQTLKEKAYLYKFYEDAKELKDFIARNFRIGRKDAVKIQIDSNNFACIYQKWLHKVMPSIEIDWEAAKKQNILPVDFYLADLLSGDDETLADTLFVVLEEMQYRYDVQPAAMGAVVQATAEFKDNQEAHAQFWSCYERPPKEEYWDYIIERRDLFMPQDMREHRGAFYTPIKWINLSQKYLERELGEDWQKDYYIWDCCAGIGNLFTGLTNKDNIFASTFDMQDVKVMRQRIAAKNLNLCDDHVFQFDFLNDPFTELPQLLQDILSDPEKRKHLIIYINPLHAEVTRRRQSRGDVAVTTEVYRRYTSNMGVVGRELLVQLLIRIYHEMSGCILAHFSKLKILQALSFKDFRNVFQAKLSHLFIVPANTFDNVVGKYPIGFYVWHTARKEMFTQIKANVYDENGNYISRKSIIVENSFRSINDWIISTRKRRDEKAIGYMSAKGYDLQNVSRNFIVNNKKQLPHPRGTWATDKNLKEIAVYYAVRHCIERTWLNDHDQFLYPRDTWKDDTEFQNNCLAYILFHGQNKISVTGGTNHWIPFTEEEVGVTKKFDSHFMVNFIKGKEQEDFKKEQQRELFDDPKPAPLLQPIIFSPEAQAMMNAGQALWQYYHKQEGAEPNASFYDIRRYFQDEKDGRMFDSNDKEYMRLIRRFRSCLYTLTHKIEPKVYEHGFLMK